MKRLGELRKRNLLSGAHAIMGLSGLLLFSVALFAAGSAVAGPVVLFDQGHKQQFLVEKNGPLDLSSFAALFDEQGAQVKSTDSPLTAGSLAGIDILIISGAFAPVGNDEAAVIMDFLNRGGKVAAMLHIPSPYMWLLPELGVSVSSGVVMEQENIIGTNGQDFQIKDLSSHPLTSGLAGFNIYGGWALLARNEKVESLARSSGRAWVDLNRNGVLNERDAVQSFSLVLTGRVGMGSFVVFGDDAVFQNQFLEGANLTLARNLVAWLCGTMKSI